MNVGLMELLMEMTKCRFAYATFGDDRLRGLGVAMGRISRFPIDLRRRNYNTILLRLRRYSVGLLHIKFH